MKKIGRLHFVLLITALLFATLLAPSALMEDLSDPVIIGETTTESVDQPEDTQGESNTEAIEEQPGDDQNEPATVEEVVVSPIEETVVEYEDELASEEFVEYEAELTEDDSSISNSDAAEGVYYAAAETYFYLLGEKITSANYTTKLKGSISYNPETHTLTLNNYSCNYKSKSNDDSGYLTWLDQVTDILTINLIGNNSITIQSNCEEGICGISSEGSDNSKTEFTGSGNLKFITKPSENCGYCNYISTDTLVFSGTGEIDLKSSSDYFIDIIGIAANSINMNSGTLKVTCGDALVMASGVRVNSFKMTGGAVTLRSGHCSLDETFSVCLEAEDITLNDGILMHYGDSAPGTVHSVDEYKMLLSAAKAKHGTGDPINFPKYFYFASDSTTAVTTDPMTINPTVTEPTVTVTRVPSLKKPKAAKKGKVTVSWKAIKKNKKGKQLLKNIKNIEIQLSTDPNFTTIAATKTVGKKKTKAVFKKLQKKTVYYVRVRYVGNDGGVSNWSAVKKVKTKK